MKLKFSILAFSAASLGVIQADYFTGTASAGLWNTSRWNTATDAAPYSSAWVAGNHASFNAGTHTFTGGNTSGAVTIGNITLASGTTVNFSGTSATNATSATRTINIGSGLVSTTGTNATAATLTLDGTGNYSYGDGTNANSGAIALIKNGDGTQILGGQNFKTSYFADSTANTFTGGNGVALTAVPEPAAAFIGSLGLLAILRRRRY